MQTHYPPHPGSVPHEYLGTLPVTVAAQYLCVSRASLSRVLNGYVWISADLAIRLAEALGTSPDFWLGMQTKYDIWRATKGRRKKIEPLQRSAA